MGLCFLTAEPSKDSEYIGYVQDRTQPEWLRPIILQWYQGAWYFPRSDKLYPNKVFGWSGPLPKGKLCDPHPPVEMEFDL